MKRTFLKIGFFCFALLLVAGSCSGTKEALDITDKEKMAFDQQEGDTIQIANKLIEYEIIIIEPGFQTWLQSIARPEGYYSQSFLENRNQIMVTQWNQRVLDPLRYDPRHYQLQIYYDSTIDYGYEVNYKLYYYFVYFQRKYKQRLGPFLPRI